jgi:phage antirepressor YoqD-like protein
MNLEISTQTSDVVTATMSSIEIVALINNLRDEDKAELHHRTFMTKVSKVLGEDAQNFLHIYKDSMNRDQRCFNLPKREASLMVMSESYEVQAKVYDRMVELEKAIQTPAAPAFVTRSQLIQIALEQEINIEKQAKEIEVAKPAVEMVERYVVAQGNKCFTEAAKVLRYKPHDLAQRLHQEGVIFKRGNVWLPYAVHENAGRFAVKTYEANGRTYSQTRVTPKGLVWIGEKYPSLNVTQT